jgi:hypothetical protein
MLLNVSCYILCKTMSYCWVKNKIVMFVLSDNYLKVHIYKIHTKCMNNALYFTDDLDCVFILSVNRTLHFFVWFRSFIFSWSLSLLNCHSLSPLSFWGRIPLRRGVLDTTFCNKVCQWIVTGWWFFPATSTPVSSTNKTDRHAIAEILLKVALNIINQTMYFVLTGRWT